MNSFSRIRRFVWAFALLCAGTAWSAGAQTAPFAHTQIAGPITSSNATLTGMVVPNGLPTAAWFEWGTNGVLDQATSAVGVGAGSAVVWLSSAIENLAPGQVFQCRLLASNAAGVALGGIHFFSTGKKVAAWGGNWSGQATVPPGYSKVVAAAAGGAHNIVQTADGQVNGWGNNYSGEVVIPTDLTNACAFSCGAAHSLALRVNGTVSAWGANSVGQCEIPENLTNVVTIAAGRDHSLALSKQGTVVGWGYNEYGQSTIPAGLSNIVAVAAGADHSMVLRADGTVVAWGDNYWGQRSVPDGLTNVTAISAGHRHSLALKQDGTVVAWGQSSYNATSVPAGLTGVVAINGGYSHSLALKADGTVVSWGGTIDGPGSVPEGLSGVATISSGSESSHCLAIADNLAPTASSQTNSTVANHELVVQLSALDRNGDPLSYRVTALPTSGSIYQYTNGVRGAAIQTVNEWVTDDAHRVIFGPYTNGFGDPYASFQFLANDGELDSLPATITLAVNGRANAYTAFPTEIRATSAALNGTVQPNGLSTLVWFEWGNRGGFGQSSSAVPIGEGLAVMRASAAIVGLTNGGVYQCRLVVSNAAGVVAGGTHLFTTGRRVTAWGLNANGQTTLPSGLSNVVALAGGTNFSLALKADGTVVGWGDDTQGQTSVPANLTNAVAIACGAEHSLALRADGSVTAWGRNNVGQTSIPAGLSNIVAVAAGPAHSLALRADGTVVAWGTNAPGQPPNSPGQAPIPASLTNVVAIAANASFNVALKVDGSVATWPYTGYSTVPSGLGNVIAITAAGSDAFALRSDSTVRAWGYYPNLPWGLSNVVSLAAGNGHCLAVQESGAPVVWKTQYPAPNYGQADAPTFLTNAAVVAAGFFHSLAAGNNQRPAATVQSTYGYPNSDLLIQLSGTDTNSDLLGFRIGLLPTAGSLYQYTPGGRGAAITVLSKVVSDAQGRVIFVPAPDAVGRPYTTFTFIANDGELDSAQATVTVNIIPAPVIDASSLNVGTNGAFSLTFYGLSNTTCRVWGSTNLATWTLLRAIGQSAPGVFLFTDTAATNWPRRFYRVTYL